MRKIGGVNMNAVTRVIGKIAREETSESTIYESLKESLKEVKLIKEGKIKPKTWQEILGEIEYCM